MPTLEDTKRAACLFALGVSGLGKSNADLERDFWATYPSSISGSLADKKKFALKGLASVVADNVSMDDLERQYWGTVTGLGSVNKATLERTFWDGVLAGSISISSPTALVSDSFNRADGAIGTADIGGAWSLFQQGGGVASGFVVSNQSRLSNTVGTAEAHAVLNTGQINHDVTVTFSVVQNFMSVLVRYIDANNFVMLQKEGGASYSLYRRVVGGFTLMGTTSTVAPADGDVLRVVVNGTSYKMYQNGVLRLDLVDAVANVTGTSVGIRTGNATDGPGRFDDFSAV